MLYTILILLQTNSLSTNGWEKLGFLGCALLAIGVLWRKMERTEVKYLELLERISQLEVNSTRAIENNTEALEKLTERVLRKDFQ